MAAITVVYNVCIRTRVSNGIENPSVHGHAALIISNVNEAAVIIRDLIASHTADAC